MRGSARQNVEWEKDRERERNVKALWTCAVKQRFIECRWKIAEESCTFMEKTKYFPQLPHSLTQTVPEAVLLREQHRRWSASS